MSKGSNLNCIDVWFIIVFGGDVQRTSVIASDDEYDGGRVEGHSLFGPVSTAMRHHNRTYRVFDAGQGAVLNGVWQTGQARTKHL